MTDDSQQPFMIAEPAKNRAIVRYSDLPRRPQTPDQESLIDLVDRAEKVAIDLTAVRNISTKWIRLFARMTRRAQKAGKVVALVGVPKHVAEAADQLALRDVLVTVGSVSEVWKL